MHYINNDFPSKHTSYSSLPVSPFPLKLIIRTGFKISSVLSIFCLSLVDFEANVHSANYVLSKEYKCYYFYVNPNDNDIAFYKSIFHLSVSLFSGHPSYMPGNPALP